MSNMAGLIDSEKSHKIIKSSFHRRNDSGELDVFEASRYFSGYNEVIGYNNNGSGLTQKMMMMREDQNLQRHGGHRGRISLDMPIRNLLDPQQFHGGIVMEKQIVMKEKKHNKKQPNSPGGRLASFLNSLFTHSSSSSKKKKSKSITTTQSIKEEDRRRRSSISHFRSSSTTSTTTTTTTTNADSKSLYSSFSSSGGFTTPTKSCKEFRTLSKYEFWDDDDDHKKKKKENYIYSSSSNGVLEKHRKWGNELSEKEFRKFNIDDDGAESDSSSDLFELQNYDLGYCSSGLPVYETTNMDNIKRGAPISNGPL